nr:unnamed protein product [Fasciola hepatica]
MPDLIYDSELAVQAQAWANECEIRTEELDYRYTRKNGHFGQNIFRSVSFGHAFERTPNVTHTLRSFGPNRKR